MKTLALNHCLKSLKMSKSKVFKKKAKELRSQGQNCWFPCQGLVTRNTHVKYHSSSSHCSKFISKVKVSDRIAELRNYRRTDKTKTICHPILDLGGIKIFMQHTKQIYLYFNIILL